MPDPGAARHQRNSLVLLGADVLGRGVAALFQILLARHLGQALFGEFTFALSLAAIVGMASDLGLSALVTREVSRRRDAPWAVVRGALWGRGLLAVGLGLLAVLATAGTGRPRSVVEIVAILVAMQLVAGQGEVFAAGHRGRERMALPALAALATRLGVFGAGLVAMHAGAGVRTFALLALGFAAPLTVVLGAALPGPRRGGWPGLRPVGALLRRSLPIGIGAALFTFAFRADVLILAWLRGDAAAGLYAGAFRIFEAALLVQGPLLAATFPILARRAPGQAAHTDALHRTARTLAFGAAPLAALLLVEGPALTAALLGAEYRGAGSALRLLGPAVLISSAAAPWLSRLLAGDREGVYARIMALSATLIVLLGAPLSLLLGISGMAGARVAVEAAVLLAVLAVAVPTEERRFFAATQLRALVLGAVAAGLLLAAAAGGVPFWPRAIALAVLAAIPALRALLR